MIQKEIIDIIYDNFQSAIEVTINDEVFDSCSKFANDVNPTTKYNDCGQVDMSKRLIDNLIGKIAEFGVYGILNKIGKDKNFNVCMPDINIYKGKKKNWKSDLAIETDDGYVSIAVKSQSLSQALKYSFSGTFQIASFRKDKVFDNANELIFLCLVDDVNSKYKKILILPPKKVSDITFADPKLPKFRGIKTCYYAKDNFNAEQLKTWMTDFGVKNVIF